MVLTLFDLLWVMPQSVIDLLSSWQGSFCGHRSIDHGGLYHIVSYGVFGENETQDVSRGRNSLLLNLILSFSTPCWSGVRPLIFFLLLNF